MRKVATIIGVVMCVFWMAARPPAWAEDIPSDVGKTPDFGLWGQPPDYLVPLPDEPDNPNETPNQHRRRLGLAQPTPPPPIVYGVAEETPNHRRAVLDQSLQITAR